MPGLFSQRRGTVRTLQVSVCSVVTRSAVLWVFHTILCIFYIILRIFYIILRIFILFYVYFVLFYVYFILFYVYFILFYVIFLYYSIYRLCVYVYKPLPPGVYRIVVDKYININISRSEPYKTVIYSHLINYLAPLSSSTLILLPTHNRQCQYVNMWCFVLSLHHHFQGYFPSFI
jgi:hypothetical protein